MADIDVVNYRPSWQKLRVSCMREYNPYGGMSVVTGAEDSIQRIVNYCNDALSNTKVQPDSYVQAELERMGNTIQSEYASRCYRAHHFMQATINGLISQPQIHHVDIVQQYATLFRNEVDLGLVQELADNWKWDVVRFELEEMWRNDRMWFMNIYKDMRERVVEKDKTAQSMTDFIGLMNEVNSLGQTY